MDSQTYRRFNGGVGIFTIGLAVVFTIVLGVSALTEPAALLLVSALVVAGALDIVAAVDSVITERIAWYKISGVAHIILGIVLSLWFASAIGGAGSVLIFALIFFSTAGVGIDMLLYDGRHVYDEPLEA